MNGNVYSGICNVSIPNYDKLTVEYDIKQYLIKVHWKIYSAPPNPNQWIGIYDIQNKLLTYEYVSNNSKNPNYQLADIGTEANGWPNEDISLYYGVKEKGIIRYEEAKEE